MTAVKEDLIRYLYCDNTIIMLCVVHSILQTPSHTHKICLKLCLQILLGRIQVCKLESLVIFSLVAMLAVWLTFEI